MIDATAFEDADDSALITIFREGRARHKIRIAPRPTEQSTGAYATWIQGQGVGIRDLVQAVVARGLKAPDYSTTAQARDRVVIVERRTEPSFPTAVADPIRLNVEAAAGLLTRPLRVLVENARNDWGFLRKAVPRDWQVLWEKATNLRWLEPEHGGGIGEMREIIEGPISQDHERRVRTWVLFDSDAREPGRASAPSERARHACEAVGVSYHQLARRAIENYIPKDSLFEWALRCRRPDRPLRRQRAVAYFSMSDAQRHHFNIKKGFVGDTGDGGVSQIFQTVSPAVSGILVDGIHTKLAAHVWGDSGPMGNFQVAHDSLARDGSDAERASLFQSIFAHV